MNRRGFLRSAIAAAASQALPAAPALRTPLDELADMPAWESLGGPRYIIVAPAAWERLLRHGELIHRHVFDPPITVQSGDALELELTFSGTAGPYVDFRFSERR